MERTGFKNLSKRKIKSLKLIIVVMKTVNRVYNTKC